LREKKEAEDKHQSVGDRHDVVTSQVQAAQETGTKSRYISERAPDDPKSATREEISQGIDNGKEQGANR